MRPVRGHNWPFSDDHDRLAFGEGPPSSPDAKVNPERMVSDECFSTEKDAPSDGSRRRSFFLGVYTV